MGHRSGFATPLYPFGASALSSSGSSSCLDSWRMAFSRSTVVTLSSPFGPSSDKAGSKRIMHFVGLLWPLLTSRSAGRPNSAMPASPFQASGETSPGKNDDLPRTIAGSTPLPLGRRSFAVSGPLAPVRSASYPVPVRRLTGSFHASFSVRLTTNALRFPSVPATRFREDFHLQVIAHAGPTTKSPQPVMGCGLKCKLTTSRRGPPGPGDGRGQRPCPPTLRDVQRYAVQRMGEYGGAYLADCGHKEPTTRNGLWAQM